MITLNQNGILIEMQGTHYSAEDIELLNHQLINLLEAAAQVSEERGMDYWLIFALLKDISPTYDQLAAIHTKKQHL